ncbi:hypothetical protein AB0E08_46250 [Streptomyces sp. NPDC048281]|uniref:hypothetical protein n=1 Tax=Streptomyces sp. NPDC048281 TaxID=3154715 RepID=UPI003440D31E
MTAPTGGHKAELADVLAEVTGHLDGITDPRERYHRATAAQAHHQAVAAALQTERDMALADINAPGPDGQRLTYEQIAQQVTVGLTRAGVQKAVERGRKAQRQA